MDCPRCSAELVKLESEDRVVHTCASCGGLWIDVADLNRALLHHNLPGLESIGGKINTEALTGQCPDCLVDLVSVDGGNRASPLHYDTCESCGGIFLEEEFRDADSYDVAQKGIINFFERFSGKQPKRRATV